MAQRFQHKSTASAGSFRIYGKTGAQAGKVYDFADGTWDAIGSATTPYIAATKLTDFYGTGQHQFFANIDLSDLNATDAEFLYEIAFFSSATPATTDNPTSDLLEFSVINGWQEAEPIPMVEIVSTELGDECQLAVWLEHLGKIVDLAALDAGATCRVTAREHGSAVGVLLFDTDDPAVTWTLRGNVLEAVVTVDPDAAPINVQANVQYDLAIELTENGVTHVGHQQKPS